jgi:hypothetical protein
LIPKTIAAITKTHAWSLTKADRYAPTIIPEEVQFHFSEAMSTGDRISDLKSEERVMKYGGLEIGHFDLGEVNGTP